MSALSPLTESPSLDKLAYNKIKDAILTFIFVPDQILLEGELASQLGISKTPVRDALMRLEKEGLVNRVPYKGTFVSTISKADMVDLFQIRTVMEGLAVRLACNHLTTKDHEKLDQLVMKQNQALEAKEVTLASEFNNEFHNLIISFCGNPRLIQMLHNLDDRLKRYRLLSIAQGARTGKATTEHKAILEALAAYDPQTAEMAMKAHLESAMTDLNNQDFSSFDFNNTYQP